MGFASEIKEVMRREKNVLHCGIGAIMQDLQVWSWDTHRWQPVEIKQDIACWNTKKFVGGGALEGTAHEDLRDVEGLIRSFMGIW